MQQALQQAAQALRQANRIVLSGHENPDGDSIGCCLALAHVLRAMGKAPVPVSSDGVPVIYQWMPGHEMIIGDTPRRDFDLAVLVDTASLARVGRVRPALETARTSLCIDHHISEAEFGEVRLVQPSAAAAAEVVYRLLCELGAPITRDIAECLLCGIITDTGSYRFMNVTPDTFAISAQLMATGAKPATIADLVFDSRSYASLRLLGRALDHLQTSDDGRIAWSTVQSKDFADFDASDEDTEGIVTHVRATRGALVGVLFREVPGRGIRVSLRARPGADVNAVAARFGGGGHALAAGCTLDAPLSAAVEAVLTAAREAIG